MVQRPSSTREAVRSSARSAGAPFTRVTSGRPGADQDQLVVLVVQHPGVPRREALEHDVAAWVAPDRRRLAAQPEHLLAVSRPRVVAGSHDQSGVPAAGRIMRGGDRARPPQERRCQREHRGRRRQVPRRQRAARGGLHPAAAVCGLTSTLSN